MLLKCKSFNYKLNENIIKKKKNSGDMDFFYLVPLIEAKNILWCNEIK